MPPIRLKKCSFQHCKSNSSNFNGKFFLFRNHDFESWVERSGNPRLRSLSQKNLVNNHYVCSLHFKNNDFTRPITPYKDKLKKEALPSPASSQEVPARHIPLTSASASTPQSGQSHPGWSKIFD